MTCHSQLYTQTAMLAPVRESLAERKPIHWNKVNKLPDYVYFDHSIHIAKGVGCTTCHGPVGHHAADAAGRAADHGLVSRLPSQPGAELAPAADVFDADWQSPADQARARRHCSRIKISTIATLPIARSATDERAPHFDWQPAPRPTLLDRRAALKLFVSGAALALASCGRPDEQVVPYVEIPERETPGIPLRFATALSLAGYGRGVIVTSVEGRPIKVEGNPRHPASLGATDVFAEAAVLSLYDPDRSKAPFSDGRIQPWGAFEGSLHARLQRLGANRAPGLRCSPGA